MPHPKAVHVDVPLTNVSLRYSNAAYVGESMFPIVNVKKESDKYFIYGKEHYVRHGTLRTNSSVANEVNWTLSTSTYSCEEYALQTPVSDRERENADNPIKPDTDATEMLTDMVKLDWEVRYQTEATAGTSFASGNTATPSTKWDGANPTIQTDIFTGQETVRSKIQRYPNTIFIPSWVAMYMSLDSTIRDLIKYTHSDLLISGPDKSWYLPPVLWGMRVVVMMAVQNTANLAQSETLSDIWSDGVIMAYINPSPGLKQISWGYTFQSRPWRVKTWREEDRDADIIQVSVIRDVKIIATGAAYYLSNCLSSI